MPITLNGFFSSYMKVHTTKRTFTTKKLRIEENVIFLAKFFSAML